MIKRRVKKMIKALKSSVSHIIHADDDILSREDKEKLQNIQQSLDATPKTVYDLKNISAGLVAVCGRKRFSSMREYLDIIAVAFAVAFGARALFLQPFKIPTSSMQPTLFGIHYVQKDKLPLNLSQPLNYLLFGGMRAQARVAETGRFLKDSVRSFSRFMIFDYTSFKIGDETFTLPGTERQLASYLKLGSNPEIQAGSQLSDGFLVTGDHLFVDRFSHYFRELKRGDITVFNTEGIYSGNKPLAEQSGFYYIKRLAGLPGDTLLIKDNKLFIKPRGRDEFAPATDFSDKFNKIYSGKGGYHGHLKVVSGGLGYAPANNMGLEDETFTVPEDCYFMMGDNSLFSSDSRVWGVVPRKNIVGRAFFVFWPFSRRWGIADWREPLKVNTREPLTHTFRAMHMQ